MFRYRVQRSRLHGAFIFAEVVFHTAVRKVRSMHRNALMAILVNLSQALIFVAVFYLMFTVLGLRKTAIRGDFLLYLLSGIFMYLTHVKAVQAVAGAEGPNSPLMLHGPMNTMVSVVSGALAALYIQVLTVLVILFVYHTAFTPITIEEPIPTLGMLLLAWFTGCCVGMVFLALKPWAPTLVNILIMIYRRANMIASGKMFVANMLPAFMLSMFDWNPLFHIIDQARGFIFINYNPHFSSWEYAFWVGIVLMTVGLMGEFFTRQRSSRSWAAGS